MQKRQKKRPECEQEEQQANRPNSMKESSKDQARNCAR